MADYAPRRDEDLDQPARTDKEILREARDRLKQCIEENSDNRREQKDDLKFRTLDQWPSDIRTQRESEGKPCLTIDQSNQYLDQIVNDGLQNKPAVKIRPVDDGGDVETAEVLQGVVRQIEDASVAEIAYGSALRSAVNIGEGYFRVITEYENEKSFNQQIRIRPIQDTFCCYLGYHVMPDGSDAKWGFVFEDFPLESFRRMYPKAKYQNTDFDEVEDYWCDEEKIRVCEYFYCDYETQKLIFTADGQSLLQEEYDALPDPKPEIQDERTTQIESVKWCKLTGVEILEKRDWAGKYIPIIKVIGKESWLNGKRYVWGLIRSGKDSLRMYNYIASTITEKWALVPKTPFIIAEGQLEGHEKEWGDANNKNLAFLSYKPVDVNGLSVPPPQRQPAAPVEVAMVQQLQMTREDIQASFGMYRAALGKEQPNQSGKAILALTRESDTGTFHYSNNQKLAIMYCGRILVDLIPKIYDTKRVIRIVGEDGKVATAEIDPNQTVAKQEIRTLEGKVRKIYNFDAQYDVSATVGPSFNTKRMEAAAMFTDLSNSAKDPISAAVVRLLAVKNSDFHGATEATEMLEKVLNMQMPGIVKQEGQPEIPPQVQAQMMKMQQALQMLSQENQQLKADLPATQMKIQAGQQEAQAKLQVQSQENQQNIQLEREKAAADIQITREKAQADIQLEREKAAAQIEIEKMKAGIKVETDKMKIESDERVKLQTASIEGAATQSAAKSSQPQVNVIDSSAAKPMESLAKSLESVSQAMIESSKQSKNGNKSIRIIKKNGEIVGAEVSSS